VQRVSLGPKESRTCEAASIMLIHHKALHGLCYETLTALR
jgi:hypothetical protein